MKRSKTTIVYFSIVIVLLLSSFLVSGCNVFNGTSSPTPLKVELSVKETPKLNVPARVSCNIITIRDIQTVTVKLTAARRLTTEDSDLMAFPYVVSDNITRSVSINAERMATTQFDFTLKEEGLWVIKAVAQYVMNDGSKHGDFDTIYFTLEKGDIEGKPSSQNEAPVENIPKPPAIRPDGTLTDS